MTTKTLSKTVVFLVLCFAVSGCSFKDLLRVVYDSMEQKKCYEEKGSRVICQE